MPGQMYRFAGFELDEPRFELRRGDACVHLPPKAMDLLLLLVRHRDRVVSKEELLERLWPGTTVTEASLGKALGAARRALGDSVMEQRFIRTVHGRGLRFIATLETREGPRAAPRVGDDPETVFVGRADVLAAIAGATAAARGGSGRLILLAGEPGIGKTRVALEAAARSRDAGVPALSGWCPDDGGAPELWPWIQLLRQAAAEHGAGELTAGLEAGLGDLVALVPALATAVRGARPPLDPAQARYRLLDTVVELLRRTAAGRRLLLVIDDLHRADAASLTVLRMLARVLPDSFLVVLGTYRDEEIGDGHLLREIGGRPGCLRLTLQGLAPDEVGRLVDAIAGVPVPPSLATRLCERTEGNPFFVKEIARALVEAGRLDAAAASAIPLPGGVRGLLGQRLALLSPGCRDLLAVAVTIGPEFDLGLLAHAAGRDTAAVLALLDEARAAHVVREAGGQYRWSHALVREALLAPLPASERARLHRRVGEALEARHRGDLEPQLPQLARHFCAAAATGVARQAVAYARRAGDRAVARLAPEEAAEHYRSALDAQSLLVPPDDTERGDLLLALGTTLVRHGRSPEGREVLRRAAGLARHTGNHVALARVAIAAGGLTLSPEVGVADPELVALLDEALAVVPEREGALRVRLLARLAFALPWSPEHARTGEVAREAVELARRGGDPVALGYALYGHRWSLVGPDEGEAKVADSNEILAIAAATGDAELELAGRASRFQASIELARIADADRDLAEYVRLADALRVPRYRWRALFYRAMRAMLAGRLAESEELAYRAQAEEQQYMPGDAGQVFAVQMLLLRREQDRLDELAPALRQLVERFPALPALRATLAVMDAELGREAEARCALATLADPGLRAFPRDFLWISSMTLLAELCAHVGDAALARRLYDELRPYAPRAVVVGAGTGCRGALDHYLGLLLRTAGDVAGARRHLEAALAMNRALAAPAWEAWTELELARLLAGTDRERARAHLARASGIATAVGLTRLARRAAGLRPALE